MTGGTTFVVGAFVFIAASPFLVARLEAEAAFQPRPGWGAETSADPGYDRMRTDRQVTQPSSFSNSLMSTVITR